MNTNTLGLYELPITKDQASLMFKALENVDVYRMSVGEYINYALILEKLEQVIEDKNEINA